MTDSASSSLKQALGSFVVPADRPAPRRARCCVRARAPRRRCGTSRFALGFPLAASGEALVEALRVHCAAGARGGAARVHDRELDRRARRSARAEAVARSPQLDRRRLGQGRRRQVDRGREFRARVGGRRARRSACSTPTSTARASRACWASSGGGPRRATASCSSRSSRTASRPCRSASSSTSSSRWRGAGRW